MKIVTKKLLYLVLVFSLSVLILSCSSGSKDDDKPSADSGAEGVATQQVVNPTATSKPAPKKASESKPAPEKAPKPKPTATPTPKSVPTAKSAVAKPTAVPKPTTIPTATPTVPPTAVPTVTPTPTPTVEPTPLSDVFKIHGFTLSLDPNSSFPASDLQVSGLLGNEADESQGILKLNYNGVDVVFYWQPNQSGSDNEAQVEAALALLAASKPTREFNVISQGEISPDGENGIYSGFLSTAKNDKASPTAEGAGGGLIGAWQCGDVAFTMTVSGPDATVIQIRFDRLVENFKCS